jgi:hypothetical protein
MTPACEHADKTVRPRPHLGRDEAFVRDQWVGRDERPRKGVVALQPRFVASANCDVWRQQSTAQASWCSGGWTVRCKCSSVTWVVRFGNDVTRARGRTLKANTTKTRILKPPRGGSSAKSLACQCHMAS